MYSGANQINELFRNSQKRTGHFTKEKQTNRLIVSLLKTVLAARRVNKGLCR